MVCRYHRVHMLSPERPQGQEAEHEPLPYCHASRYPGEKPAARAYRQAERVIFNAADDVDLSAYRFHVERIWHVAVKSGKRCSERNTVVGVPVWDRRPAAATMEATEQAFQEQGRDLIAGPPTIEDYELLAEL
jgi:hypothetical protein